MIEWIIIVGLAVAMYIVIYKYEKKMDNLHKMVQENKQKLDEHHSRIEKNHEKITSNHERLNEHYNHIEQMWVTLPKSKSEDRES
jgi:uncharacterized coiled-coil DUF342 family protein